MKTTLFAIALLASGAALAQVPPEVTTTEPIPEAAVTETAPADAMPVTTVAAVPSTGSVQAPGNTNPERDARGIPVISDPAIVPAGYNGTASTGVGGPLVDPATGEAVNTTDTSHPPCSRTVTDNCVQTYERSRSPE